IVVAAAKVGGITRLAITRRYVRGEFLGHAEMTSGRTRGSRLRHAIGLSVYETEPSGTGCHWRQDRRDVRRSAAWEPAALRFPARRDRSVYGRSLPSTSRLHALHLCGIVAQRFIA